MKASSLVVAFAAILSCLCSAQTPPPDGLVFPEAHSDRTVTFRVRTEGNGSNSLWRVDARRSSQPMTKSDDGAWTIQTAPLQANGHLYWFNADGVAVPDPISPVLKLRQRSSASLVALPRAGAEALRSPQMRLLSTQASGE
jgi:hypothetical protein